MGFCPYRAGGKRQYLRKVMRKRYALAGCSVFLGAATAALCPQRTGAEPSKRGLLGLSLKIPPQRTPNCF